MDISIIIPTYNNSKILRKTLENISKINTVQDISYEIIVVNNNSTDDTQQVLDILSKEFPIKSFFQPQQGISHAKNTGIINSTGKLVIFTDDDIRPDINWMSAYWKAYCNNPDGYFWGGSVVSEFESIAPSKELLRYAPPSVRGLDLGPNERLIDQHEYFIGASWACTRETLENFGLFNIELGLNPSKKAVMVGEETELMERLRKKGYQSLYLPNATVHHFVPTKKTTLKHIADRNEALGYFREAKNIKELPKYKTPKWVYRSIIENFTKYCLLNLGGRDASKEYIEFKKAKGIMRAVFDSRKAKFRGCQFLMIFA